MTTLAILLEVFSRVGDLILALLEDEPDSGELRDEALARFAELQEKLLSHDAFAAELQDELDAAVPPK